MHARFVAFGLVVVASAGAAFLACDLEADTHYGQHSGLNKSNLPNPPPPDGSTTGGDGGAACGTPVDAGTCAVSFQNDIWSKMSTTWHCSDAKCHGGTSYQPKLDTADDAYDNMMTYMIGTKPYINPCSIDPDASAFVCNISSPPCGAAQMPFPDNTLMSGPMSGSDLTLVQTWVACGAPKN
ncbi:MAG TPA: hypothetical protein VGH28_30210 [Polyangiaceae bacterium]|jgi:hypothetical protein